MILAWDKPPRAMPVEEWKKPGYDGGPPGAYVPNMSAQDAARWKTRYTGGANPRVEIRKTAASQLLLVVTEGEVRLSANGQMRFPGSVWDELFQAVAEARAVLREKGGKPGVR